MIIKKIRLTTFGLLIAFLGILFCVFFWFHIKYYNINSQLFRKFSLLYSVKTWLIEPHQVNYIRMLGCYGGIFLLIKIC